MEGGVHAEHGDASGAGFDHLIGTRQESLLGQNCDLVLFGQKKMTWNWFSAARPNWPFVARRIPAA